MYAQHCDHNTGSRLSSRSSPRSTLIVFPEKLVRWSRHDGGFITFGFRSFGASPSAAAPFSFGAFAAFGFFSFFGASPPSFFSFGGRGGASPVTVTFVACDLPSTSARVKLTFCPVMSLRKPSLWICDWCTKSSSPPSASMNPKPLAAKKRLTTASSGICAVCLRAMTMCGDDDRGVTCE